MPKQALEDLIGNLHLSEHPETKFQDVASHLMNKLCINAGGKQYRIVECEIYYNDGEKHNDPYPYGITKEGSTPTPYQEYCFSKQKEKLKWFFHYSGIDITIGNGTDKMGGILIRAVTKIKGGPSKLFITILNNIYDDVFCSKNGSIYLEVLENVRDENPITSIRIGLDKEKKKQELENCYTSNEIPFCNRKYRYELK